MIKHFLKTLVIFAGMILIGMIGVFLVSHFGAGDFKKPATDQLLAN